MLRFGGVGGGKGGGDLRVGKEGRGGGLGVRGGFPGDNTSDAAVSATLTTAETLGAA